MSRPRCPNHGVEMDPTDNRSMWICPISMARFEAHVDWQDKNQEYQKNKFGKLVPKDEWKITQADGGVGG